MRGVYGIRRVDTGRIYIGSSVYIPRRWTQHRKQLRAGKHSNRALQSDWNVLGEDAFAFELVEHLPVGDLDPREQHHIDLNATNCYNEQRTVATLRATLEDDEVRYKKRLDEDIFWEWATTEIADEWTRAGKVIDPRADAGRRSVHNREFTQAVRVRCEALRATHAKA